MFRDVESGEEIEVDPAAIRASYLERMNELLTLYKTKLTEANIDYVPLDTRQPFDHALSAYLQRRGRMRK